jgi:chromosome partitioning protein
VTPGLFGGKCGDMIYLIGHTKGGVGKTSLATNLAALLAAKHAVCLVDADGQMHANQWAGKRLEQRGLAPIDCRVLGGKVRLPIAELTRRYAHVVVDAGGSDSQELRSALCIANVCLAPFSPSQNDLAAFNDLRKVLADAVDINPELRVFAVPNKVEPHAKRQDRLMHATAYVAARGFEVLSSRLTLRPAPYNRTSETGRGLGELPDAAAYAELIAALGEVHTRMRQVAA